MRLIPIFLLLLCGFTVMGQANWKLVKDKNDIRVYTSFREQSKFKSIRVQCMCDGTISRLLGLLKNVSTHKDWVYKTSETKLLKELSANEFIYYSKASMPWPVTDRDGVFRFKYNFDTARHTLRVSAYALPDYMPAKSGIIRVPYSKASWLVTEARNRLNIDYVFEVDPGGSLPAWMVNMFADKGPYETFYKLESLLKG